MLERPVEIAGETLIARADRTLFWPAQSTLFIADVHFGKAAAFRSAAVPVPVGTTAAILGRLSQAVSETSSSRVVFLGDLYHAKEGRRDEIFESLRVWRELHGRADMILVEGNHDRKTGALPETIGINRVDEPHRLGPFALCHYPGRVADAYCLAGHIHPSVSLRAKARQSLRLPCFWFSNCCGVLPAFGEFTGTADVTPCPGDQVLVIADDKLHTVSN